MIVPDGSFNLEEDGNYKIEITAKYPADGTLQINMGSWSANDQATFPIEASDDFQTVECDFEGWSVNAEGAHLLFPVTKVCSRQRWNRRWQYAADGQWLFYHQRLLQL